MFENIEESRRLFDDLNDMCKKAISQLFAGFRKYIGK